MDIVARLRVDLDDNVEATMDLSDIHKYLQRDWGASAALDDRHWRERLSVAGPGAVLAATEAARQLIQTVRPDWPGSEERAADLENHVRLAALWRRVQL
jgi:hypothetical protein